MCKMTSTLHFVLWITIASTSAYKCSEEGCFINHTEDNRNLDLPTASDNEARSGSILIQKGPAYTVLRSQRPKISSKVEDDTRKENGSYKILNENPRFYPKIGSRIGEVSEDKVVFPGPTSRNFPVDVPEECKKTGVCEDVPNYPEEQVAAIVASVGEATNKFHIDELDIPETPDIAQRIGSLDENMELCTFDEKIIYPKAAPDKNGDWYWVVNPKDNPVQGFRVEICRSKTSCADFASFRPGYHAQCIQKHFRRSMQVLDESGELVEKLLTLPSCCSCVVTLPKKD